MATINSKDWFASWFDTKYYHTLYQHRDMDEAKRFIDNLLDYLKIPEGAKCLDLACGKGRHSKYLNEHGLDVIGLDLSENSILSAKTFENKSLRFDVHDMREVYKKDYFNVIFNLFTSFGYFDSDKDNLKVLNAVDKMLLPSGRLIIDFMNASKVIDNLVEDESKQLDGITFNIKRSYDGTHIFKNIQFEDGGQNYDFTERVQALRFKDFQNLLEQNGFNIIDVFGSFDLTPFDEKQSDRLIIIAQK